MLSRRKLRKTEQLSHLHLVTSIGKLKEALMEIESHSVSLKKLEKKQALLREQMHICRNVFKQKIKIAFTHRGKQRPLKDLIAELSHFIEGNSENGSSSDDCAPESFVGREILHRFNSFHATHLQAECVYKHIAPSITPYI